MAAEKQTHSTSRTEHYSSYNGSNQEAKSIVTEKDLNKLYVKYIQETAHKYRETMATRAGKVTFLEEDVL